MKNNISFIRIQSVQELTGLARSTIYKYISTGIFPKPVKPTPRVSAWVMSEVENWMMSKIEARDLIG